MTLGEPIGRRAVGELAGVSLLAGACGPAFPHSQNSADQISARWDFGEMMSS